MGGDCLTQRLGIQVGWQRRKEGRVMAGGLIGRMVGRRGRVKEKGGQWVGDVNAGVDRDRRAEG